jgi:PsbP
MRFRHRYAIVGGRIFAVSAIAAAGIAAGCGSSGSSTASTAAEAQSAATGDIPDNQTFLTYKDPSAGYSIVYPEGWTRKGTGSDVTFQDKQNVIHVQVSTGSKPTTSSVQQDLAKLQGSDPTLKPGQPQQVTINSQPVIKVTYTKQGPPDPVTGKRLTIIVDRYVYYSNRKVAVLDLATPVGVDNVDAYKMISESFKWQ